MANVSTRQVHDTLLRYFSKLSNTGFVSGKDTKRIIMFMFMNEMLNSELSYFMNEKDYNVAARVVRMLVGDCLIPYASYCNNRMRGGLTGSHIGSPMLLDTSVNSTMRHTQADDTRYAETTETRMAQGV